MRRLLLRSTLTFALAWTAACADDIPEVVTHGTSTGDDSTSGPGPVSADTTRGDDTTAGLDTEGSSGEPDTTAGPTCGDGNVDEGEACDGTNLDGAECTTYGFMSGELGCLPDCSAVDTSRCVPYPCGDGVVGEGEACDGEELAGEDCTSQGFAGGTLACAEDCSAFDTSGCVASTCGNEAIEGAEACDGEELAGQDCLTQGFDAGTLACAADCSAFDTAGCFHFSCGNDAVERREVCDGTDLAGQDCTTQGFDGGTLGCAADCSAFDVSSCFGCGDGVAEGTEVCDGPDLAGNDCTTQGFDGGTLACAADCAGYDTAGCHVCGDDVAEGPEACDGTDLLGNDCVSLDIGFDGGTLACDAGCGFDTSGCTRCGDGEIEGIEQCDLTNLGGQTCEGLGFDFGALGCTDECTVTPLHCVNTITETEPNDDGMVAVGTNDFLAANANGPYTADALIAAAIEPVGDDDVFAISNPGPGYVVAAIETYGAIPGACDSVDTQISLHTDTGLQLAVDGDSGIGSCSLLANVVLPPGVTVYVRVIDFGDNTAIPAYHLHIRIDPVVCGDGVGGPLEQCDDGGTTGGDGCSATCQLEGAIAEVEPNGTIAEADAAGIVITGDARIGGVIGTFGDQDRFRVELATPQFVRFETFTSLGQCNNGFGTTLRLFDAAGTPLISDAGPPNGSGIASCAALTVPLPAGTFYVQVEDTGNNSPIPTYVLEVTLLGDAGTEAEPNEDQATANTNLVGGLSDVYVLGDHSLNADSDFYAIDVPVNGSSLRLEIIEGDPVAETCDSDGIDSRLTLYDAAGTLLVNDDDDGRGRCSQIDGTGLVGQDANAHNLDAGTYYVQVRASTLAQMNAGGQFTYRLVVTVRQP